MPDDYYVSQYSGEEIDERLTAAHNAVRYDAAQTLTDAQKTQARRNIGSAPDGGGVMESATEVAASSASESYDTFCAKLDAVLATMPRFSVKFLRVYPPQYYGKGTDMCALFKSTNDYASVYTIGSYNVECQGFRMIKHKRRDSDPAGHWDPLEYINPEMQLGVEYRTTERYLGKPVYVKKVDFGNAPAGASKEVSCATNVANVVDYNLTVLNGIFGQENTIISDDGTLVARPYSKLAEGELSISLAVFEDISTRSVDLVVKYTKTTD